MNSLGDILEKDLCVCPSHWERLSKEQISQIAVSSKTVVGRSEGAPLFFAIKGVHVNGLDFVPEVYRRAPNAIILSEENISHHYPRSIQVYDLEMTLAKVAKAFFGRPDEALSLIGVTGTNGKTTTTYLCRAMLQSFGSTAMLGTIEYNVGGKHYPAPNTTPNAYFLYKMLEEARNGGDRYGALEISSHAIMQKRAYGLHLNSAIFTNLTQDHLDYHGTLEAYFEAKQRLFDGRNGTAPKTAIINIDDACGRKLFEMLKTPKIAYGFSKDADFQIIPEENEEGFNARFALKYQGYRWNIRSKLLGRHNMLNVTAAFIACYILTQNPEKLIAAIEDFDGVPGRLERIDLANGATVFVDYAHTPDALKTVLVELRRATSGKLVTVFGCGGDRDRTKRPLMMKVVNALSDVTFATSDNQRSERLESIFRDMMSGITRRSCVKFVKRRREAIAAAMDILNKGDVLLLAGKGHESYQLLHGKKYHFDDREVVRELNEKMNVDII